MTFNTSLSEQRYKSYWNYTPQYQFKKTLLLQMTLLKNGFSAQEMGAVAWIIHQ